MTEKPIKSLPDLRDLEEPVIAKAIVLLNDLPPNAVAAFNARWLLFETIYGERQTLDLLNWLIEEKRIEEDVIREILLLTSELTDDSDLEGVRMMLIITQLQKLMQDTDFLWSLEIVREWFTPTSQQ